MLAYTDRMDIHSRSEPCAGGIARRIELRDGVFGACGQTFRENIGTWRIEILLRIVG